MSWIKIAIGVIVLLIIGITWLRVQWGRSKNQNASRQIIDALQSGKYVIESYEDSLNIMIWSKIIPGEINTAGIKQYLHSLKDKKVPGKFIVQYADFNENNKGIVIGEGSVKDTIHDKEIDVFYPCWLYVDVNQSNNEASFKSTFPENKDHHYLLEELSQEIYNQCMKG